MKQILTMLAALAGLVVLAAPAAAQEAVGDWQGDLQVTPAIKLHLVVHLHKGADGALTGTIDSPDQNSFGIPIATATEADGTLTLQLPVLAASYTATWDAGAKGWNGSWSQAGQSWPFAIAPGGPPPRAATPPPKLPANWQIPTDAEIATMIDARIAGRAGECIVVGVVDASGRRIVSRGPAGGAPCDGKTLFEIGSMTKVFTGLLLADMAQKGEVKLDDPAGAYLPAGVTMPERAGRKITLLDLATHRSGLPRLPGNLAITDVQDPYADYTEAQLDDFLSHYALPRDIGSQYEYSNLGVGLLGNLLARRAGTDYASLVRARITGPLGMKDTAITLSPALQQRLAVPHDEYLRPTKEWHLPTLAGAGALRSDADDLLTFLAANLWPGQSPLAPAIAAMTEPRADGPVPALKIGIIWELRDLPDGKLVFHDGGTGGFRTFMGYDPVKKRGVVVLTNASAEPSASDLGAHLLIGSPVAATPPLPPAPKERVAIPQPAAALDRLAGSYAMGGGMTITITRDGDHLMAQLTGQAANPIYAEAPNEYFWRVVDAQLSFTADASGAITGVVLHQNGHDLPGKRVAP